MSHQSHECSEDCCVTVQGAVGVLIYQKVVCVYVCTHNRSRTSYDNCYTLIAMQRYNRYEF